MPEVDVLVVGGGPTGLVAAWEAALHAPGAAVTLVERDRAIGAPVRCAEGVGAAGLREFLDPDGAPWISRRITKVIFVAPDDTEVVVEGKDTGYVLDRTRFEPVLAERAARAGAEVLVGTEVAGLRRDGAGWEATVRSARGEERWRARVVIGADGVESMVGRWAGLETRVAARDMESAAQYVMSGVRCDPDAIYLQFSRRWAPGGYAWVFPKGEGVANVGLGIKALDADGRTARAYLDAWVAHRCPQAVVTGYTVGGVISAVTVRRTATDGVLLAGDAAHMINPLSGAGIVTGMKAGRLAGRHAARALRENDTSAANLQAYHEEWMALVGRDHVWYYRINDAIHAAGDDFLDKLARVTNAIPDRKRTMGRIFAHALVRHPSLIPVAARFFTPARRRGPFEKLS
jgi:digeranylgeranylglycerophospholipid reductase